MMFLALLWGASISCDGVCSRVQTAINDSHPLDALVMEHLTSAHHFSGLTWEPWQPATHRHLSGQRKSRSSLMKSGLQRSTIGGTLVTRASRGDHAGLNLRYPRPSSSARAATHASHVLSWSRVSITFAMRAFACSGRRAMVRVLCDRVRGRPIEHPQPCTQPWPTRV